MFSNAWLTVFIAGSWVAAMVMMFSDVPWTVFSCVSKSFWCRRRLSDVWRDPLPVVSAVWTRNLTDLSFAFAQLIWCNRWSGLRVGARFASTFYRLAVVLVGLSFSVLRLRSRQLARRPGSLLVLFTSKSAELSLEFVTYVAWTGVQDTCSSVLPLISIGGVESEPMSVFVCQGGCRI